MKALILSLLFVASQTFATSGEFRAGSSSEQSSEIAGAAEVELTEGERKLGVGPIEEGSVLAQYLVDIEGLSGLDIDEDRDEIVRLSKEILQKYFGFTRVELASQLLQPGDAREQVSTLVTLAMNLEHLLPKATEAGFFLNLRGERVSAKVRNSIRVVISDPIPSDIQYVLKIDVDSSGVQLQMEFDEVEFTEEDIAQLEQRYFGLQPGQSEEVPIEDEDGNPSGSMVFSVPDKKHSRVYTVELGATSGFINSRWIKGMIAYVMNFDEAKFTVDYDLNL